MTYCVGLTLKAGLVFMSDTRTNAGVDNISVFKKMFTWQTRGERAIVMMTAGNLATTQAVVSLLDERAKPPVERSPSILKAPSMFQVARLVGETLRGAQPALLFPVLILLLSMPHYGATLVRVYEQRESRRGYVVFSVYATLLVAACFVAGTYNTTVAIWMVTIIS